jgi:hypothetical protein
MTGITKIVVLGACHAVHIASCINVCKDIHASAICLHLINKKGEYLPQLIEAEVIVTIEGLNSDNYSLEKLKNAFPDKRFIVYPYLHSPDSFPFLVNGMYTWNEWFGPKPSTCRLRVAHRLINFWEENKDWEEAFERTFYALLEDSPEKWSWLWPLRTPTFKENDCPKTTELLHSAHESKIRLMLTDNHPTDIIYHTLASEILDKLGYQITKEFPSDLQTKDVVYPRYPFTKSAKTLDWIGNQLRITWSFTKIAVEGVLASIQTDEYNDQPWYLASKQFNEKYFNGKQDILYIAKRLAAGATEGEIP